MRKTRENEPAFPASAEQCNEYDAHPGMELRDWFAGQALSAMIGTAAAPVLLGLDDIQDETAKGAYRVADAMLKAREET